MSKKLVLGTRVLRQYLKKVEQDPFTLYLDSLSASGRRSMRSQLLTVMGMMGYRGKPEQFPWSELRYVHLAKIQSALLKKKKSINTVNTSLAGLRGVMRAAFNMGLVSADDYMRILAVKRVKSQQLPVGRSLDTKEMKKLMHGPTKKSQVGIRDNALLALMLSTGVRRAEVVSINMEDYDAKKKVMIVKQGKGARQRTLTITRGTKKLLAGWLKVRGRQDGALFTRIFVGEVTGCRLGVQTIYNMVRKRAEEAGIAPCTPHDLRRTLVTRLLDSGVDLNTVRQIIGHSDINTTARYDRRRDTSKQKMIEKVMVL